MKITKTFISIFLLTFIIGSASIFLLRNNFSPTEKQNAEKFNIETPNTIKSSQNESPKSEIISYEAAKNFGGAELLSDDYWEKEEKYKFEMLQTGEFHGDEVDAKSGEKWLGLFGENDDFDILSTRSE